MSKRSDFPKVEKDYYPTTDPRAVEPLVPFIRGKTYAEPCYGNGDLEDLLMDVAICKWRSDARETVGSSKVLDAMSLTKSDLEGIDLIVTNPPFTKTVLMPMLAHFITLKPTWLLLPADYAHNVYFGDAMRKCAKMVSVGRLKWIKNSKYTSVDNFCWYFWPQHSTHQQTIFVGRQ